MKLGVDIFTQLIGSFVKRIMDVVLFLPRLVVGAKRYTLPRGFGRRRVLGADDFASAPKTRGRDPVGRLLEHLRVAYMSILEALGGKGSVAIMSPRPQEGRSTIAANMAIAMAHDRHRPVVLIDLDLREPSLHEALGVDNADGFLDMRPGDDVEEFLKDTDHENLRVLTAGLGALDPVQALNLGVLDQVLIDLAAQDVFVVVDCPQANAFTDVQIIAEKVSGVVTVVKLGSTKRSSLAEYYRKLDGANFLGVITNYKELWIPPWLYRFL